MPPRLWNASRLTCAPPSVKLATIPLDAIEGPGNVNEAHFREIEKVLLYLSEARRKAVGVAGEIERDGAEPHLVAALAETERELADLHRRPMQGTYWAVPKQQLRL